MLLIVVFYLYCCSQLLFSNIFHNIPSDRDSYITPEIQKLEHKVRANKQLL